MTVNEMETLWFQVNVLKAQVRKIYDASEPYPELDNLVDVAMGVAERTELYAWRCWNRAKAELEDAPERICP